MSAVTDHHFNYKGGSRAFLDVYKPDDFTLVKNTPSPPVQLVEKTETIQFIDIYI